MHLSVEEWLEAHADRTAQRQRASADTLKMVATFLASVATALVASALQFHRGTTIDRNATWMLAFSLVLAVVVLMADRMTEADQAEVLRRCASPVHPLTDQQTLAELRKASVAATRTNEGVITTMTAVLILQVGVSIGAGGYAVAALLAV